MNERIEELAEQCSIEEYNQHGDLIEFGFNYEKFAELIVKECMDVVAKKCASPTAYNALVEHFGVE
jgi:hypothetical protein